MSEHSFSCTRRRCLMAAALLPLLAACGKKPKAQSIARGATVLAFGDSVTYGTGAAPGEDWPTRLAALSGWRVINAGIPGDTAEAGKQRFGALLEEHRPALVLIEIGGNDFLRRRNPKAVKEDIRGMIAAARSSGAVVVLVAVPELSLLAAVARRPSDAPLYAELAKEENVLLIEEVFSDILARPELCADQIHPNAAGYRQMAEGFATALRKSGLLAG